MKNILAQYPLDVIKQVITEFQKPSQTSTAQNTIDKSKYSEVISEISKAYCIQQQHPKDAAIAMLKEHNFPENVIDLMYENTSKQSTSAKYVYTWRLDQSVPNVQAVLLNIQDVSTGTINTMRMDMSTFHKLRFNISLLLREQELLANRIHK